MTGASHAPPAAPGIRRITTPLPFRPREVHAYLAALAGGGWMLVDGGLATDEAWAALDAGVREAAGGWDAVTLHVVTHMHMDHVGLASRVHEACGAPLAMGRLDAERAAHARDHPGEEAEYRLALLRRCGAPAEWIAAVEGGREAAQALAPPHPVSLTLDGAEGDVPGAPGWRHVWTPGHTAGHVALLRPEDGVLIAGDAVLPRITPTLGVNRQRPDPVGDYLAALDRLDALRPTLALPGHGDAIPDPAARIAALRAAARDETEAVAALLADGAADCWTVVDRRYPERELPPGVRLQALRETLAHLDRLVAAGRATVRPVPSGADGFAAAGDGAAER
jgi:glyoxylase-like metal-dependent hydrolase (beta-lactamase superfamily II)